MTVEGLDVSHHQAKTPPLGTSLEFVFIRATYGLTPDDKYAMHAANVRAAHRIVGAYHFGRYGDGAAQARAFLNVIGPTVRLVALDYEKDGTNPHMTPAQAQAFIHAVQATGRKCGLYASESGYPNGLGQDWRWVAKWGREEPNGLWAFWQYASGSHHPSGVDRDRFSGTLEQLRHMAGVPDEWHVHVPAGTALRLFTVEANPKYPNGQITKVNIRSRPWTAISRPCSAPHRYPWPGHIGRRLVKLKDGPWINAKYAKEDA